MKRTISILLCILMLLPMISVLASCSKGGDGPKVSKKTVEIKGADTNITVGGSGFYAEGCELELTMNEGTVNVSNNFVCYLSGATGSVTMGGTAKCYFTNSHAFHITNASPTVTIQGSAQVISNATSGDKEIFNIVNGANPTI